jgi:hypothetical protein
LKNGRVKGIARFTRDGNGSHWGGFNTKLSDFELEYEAWLATRPVLGDAPVAPPVTPPAGETLRDLIMRRGDEEQLIQFNKDAALQKAGSAAGYTINSPEYKVTKDGRTFVCQRMEHQGTGAVRYYYCPDVTYTPVRYEQR